MSHTFNEAVVLSNVFCAEYHSGNAHVAFDPLAEPYGCIVYTNAKGRQVIEFLNHTGDFEWEKDNLRQLDVPLDHGWMPVMPRFTPNGDTWNDLQTGEILDQDRMQHFLGGNEGRHQLDLSHGESSPQQRHTSLKEMKERIELAKANSPYNAFTDLHVGGPPPKFIPSYGPPSEEITYFLQAYKMHHQFPRNSGKAGAFILSAKAGNELDSLWMQVLGALDDGLLGPMAMVSGCLGNRIGSNGALFVVTYDYTDEFDRLRTRDNLKEIIGLKKIPYRTLRLISSRHESLSFD